MQRERFLLSDIVDILLSNPEMPADSALADFFMINDLVYHDDIYQHSFVDPLSEHLTVNHNIYTFHKTAQKS